MELARINYKGSGNWFDNLVKGVTDAIDRAIETVESMGRWLDDNLLDGRINAMYTLYQILFKFHSNLDQIGGSGSIEEEYNLIGTIGKAGSNKRYIDIVYVMVYNYIMKVKEIIKKIKSEGWYIVRQKGSHRQYKNNNIKGLVTIAGKLSDEIDKGTLNSILKQAGLK